ncbi:ABC transporter permease subunit [Aquisalimonas asiatica]|uniref:Amino acid/amide ABC transporter membrane protein 2, HAAT family n=1 Tax=Aquisalimonas asiatica TaxID=406100 RepID=A0A1H8PXK9_9GAMM|nr:ABC transporter permease [Aquisalimonas asiatica]SEO46488.1 amino acid/amide ABC transporter membrane protein 2, HAAT family [Aquisalimonas asiatica]
MNTPNQSLPRPSAWRVPYWVTLLNGPQTLGRGRIFWGGFFATVLCAALFPAFVDGWTTGNTAYFLCWVFMALGLSLIWGYSGALSFGQTAFFGIAGYGYGVVTLNFGAEYGMTFGALFMAVGASCIAAAVLGYVIFYGRISGVFLGIVTLSTTLVLHAFMAQTAGSQWAIGDARLGGHNGMTGMPPLTIPWPGMDIMLYSGVGLYYLLLVMVIVCYLALRILVNSRFGNVLVAIRENPHRAEMLGYDIRRYQLIAFIIGSGLAGLSGALYTAWGQYISPSSMGLAAAALPIVWVAVGGRKDLTATLIGTLAVLAVFQNLTIFGSYYALILMGILLVIVVLFLPQGLIPGLVQLVDNYRDRAGKGRVS